MTKTLVLYVFHIFNERVKHFIDHAIYKDDDVDFLIISNDRNNEYDAPDYVKKIYRDNIGYDFGGWSDALLTNNLYKGYDYFIFANSSIIGPFIKSDFIGKWTDIYLNGLVENVKLFGSTINTIGDPLNKSHVQSYIFALNKETLQFLIDCEIFSMTNYATTYHDAVFQKEVLMSRKIIENGWNIGSLFSYYNGVDFTFSQKQPYEYNLQFFEDIMSPPYRNALWNDYELVFIKGNRIQI
jgi:hypothetical protein